MTIRKHRLPSSPVRWTTQRGALTTRQVVALLKQPRTEIVRGIGLRLWSLADGTELCASTVRIPKCGR